LLQQEQAGRERENPLLKTHNPSRKLKKKGERFITLHREIFHLPLHLNWKKSLHPPKPQPRGEGKLHFSLPTPIANIKIRKPFTRSSTLKKVVESKVLPKVSVSRESER
jgi:hypothetical protein